MTMWNFLQPWKRTTFKENILFIDYSSVKGEKDWPADNRN